MSIKANLESIRKNLPTDVKLVAVSKFHPVSSIMEAYNAGQRVFGENRVQELVAKQADLPGDIEWHLIGHLQSNKVKSIVPFVDTIQSVDSYKILEEINTQAKKIGRNVKCLLEIHIAKEESKFGFSFDTCRQMLDNQSWSLLDHVTIVGVMGIATNTDDESEIRKEFELLSAFYQELKESHFNDRSTFKEISMGMSHDYLLAIEHGSTIIRVGTSIFGEREY